MWFLDCYSYGAMMGRDFPVNTYFDEDPSLLAVQGLKLLQRKISGIDEIRITKESKGMAPIPIDGFSRRTSPRPPDEDKEPIFRDGFWRWVCPEPGHADVREYELPSNVFGLLQSDQKFPWLFLTRGEAIAAKEKAERLL